MAMPWPWPGHHGQNSMPGTTPLLYTEVDSQCESGWDAGWPLQQGAFLLYFWAVAGSWCFFFWKFQTWRVVADIPAGRSNSTFQWSEISEIGDPNWTPQKHYWCSRLAEGAAFSRADHWVYSSGALQGAEWSSTKAAFCSWAVRIPTMRGY